MDDLFSSRAGEASELPDPLYSVDHEPDHGLEARTGLIGDAPAMLRLRNAIARYGPTRASVVIQGETGTGKELVARALRSLSTRHGRPFVAVNVAAIHPSLMLSELFGHERGAFTGAVSRQRGLFEEANGGTLFLDEIGELPLDAQAILLRVLETRELRPLGGRPRMVDVRVLVATHRNLLALMGRGLFREDLYYRLHTLSVRTPALRHHLVDVPRVVVHLLDRLAGEVGKRAVSSDGLVALQHYGWPGNVRQLQNVLCRAAALSNEAVLDRRTITVALREEPRALASTVDGLTTSVVAETFARE
ncbi:MAG: Fis family transcriptional regulator, partial [Myxococcaceae bacterium]|nr:Fis family transcriptional regulator [Myxococcaceae bacterium]